MKNNKINVLNFVQIKKSLKNEIPTYIYGAGITASKVFNYINGLGVNVSGFVVDKKNIDTLYNLPVLGVNQIDQVPVNLILGYVPTRETVQEVYNKILEKHEFINFVVYDFSFLSFGLFDDNYLNSKEFNWVNEKLEDKYSKDTLISYIKSRNSGDYTVCEKFYDANQYFAESIIFFKENETFVDCGVFDGETIKEFISRNNNSFDYIFGFEPDKSNYENSINNLKSISTKKLNIFNLGSWHKNDTLRFNSISERVSEIDPNGSVEIKVDSIDNLITDKKVSYIKMDVEGAELNSLRGAEKIIRLNKPKLAICLYHKPEDIYDITYWIDSLELNYKFYIRLHTRFSQELVLYCI